MPNIGNRTPEHGKIGLSIERADTERLRAIAYRLLDTIVAMSRSSGPDNYEVQQFIGAYRSHSGKDEWLRLAGGTHDYCIGYATAVADDCRVVCGDFIVWPETELIDG